ncbi:MAG: AEC family transporter [Oscillospiraceae bacterium]|nr:AEC family transporter [Oscillospiraceae bacterium]
MELQVILNQMAVLFLLMAVGFVIGKAKLITSEGNRIFSKFVLFVAMPCTLLSSVLASDATISAADTFFFLLLAALMFAIAFAIALPIIRLLGGKKEDRGILSYTAVFGNVGFMGIPISTAIFGIESAYYVALTIVVFSLLAFSVGILMVSGKGDSFSLKPLFNPTLIVSVLTIPIAIFDVSFPFIITDTISSIGVIATPTAMIVTGATLAYIPLKSLFYEWRVFPATALKLIAIPIVVWLIFRLFVTDELILGILVVLSAMPTAVMAVMFAIQYNGNERTATAGVFLTTLLCAVTVPLLVYFLII